MICNIGQLLRTSGNKYYGEEENSQKAVAWETILAWAVAATGQPPAPTYRPHYSTQVGLNALVAHLAAT